MLSRPGSFGSPGVVVFAVVTHGRGWRRTFVVDKGKLGLSQTQMPHWADVLRLRHEIPVRVRPTVRGSGHKSPERWRSHRDRMC